MPTIQEEGAPAASQPADPSPINVTNNNAEDIPATDQTEVELQKIAEELEKEGLTEFKEAECVEGCQNPDLPNYLDLDLFDPDAKIGRFFFSF